MRPRYEAGGASLPEEESIGDKRAAMGRMADILIANGASCANQANKNHVTCFGAAREELVSIVTAGTLDEARLLLEEDSVHPNIKDKDGMPILIKSARIGRFAMLSVLITAGADPKARWNGDFVPHLVMRNNFNQPPDRLHYPWLQAQGVLQYFVDAVNDTPGANYDWGGDEQRQSAGGGTCGLSLQPPPRGYPQVGGERNRGAEEEPDVEDGGYIAGARRLLPAGAHHGMA